MLDILRQRTRRIMLDLVLDTGLSDELRTMCINGGAGVGMAYFEAAKLGLLRLHPGADLEGFRFSDIAQLVEGVAALIDEQENRAYADLEQTSAHHRLRLRSELRWLKAAAAEPLAAARLSPVWVEPQGCI